MPPVLGPVFLRRHPFVVLGRHQRRYLFAVAQNQKESSSPCRYSSSTTRRPASPRVLPLNISAAAPGRLFLCPADDHAFACSQAVRLHDHGRVKMRQGSHDLVDGVTDGEMRRGNVIALQKLFGETLARLQSGRCLASVRRYASPAG